MTRFPSPWPGVDSLYGNTRVSAWRVPVAFEFHCPDPGNGSQGGTVRGPAGWWLVRDQGTYFVVPPADSPWCRDGDPLCETVENLRKALVAFVAKTESERQMAEAVLREREAALVTVEKGEEQAATEAAHVAAEEAESALQAARDAEARARADLDAFEKRVR